MKLTTAVVCSLAVMLWGCAAEVENPADAEELEGAAEQDLEPTSVKDPVTGIITPLNYPYEYDDAPTLEETVDKTLSLSYSTFLVGTGGNDVERFLDRNLVIVGVGAGVGLDDFVTLKIWARIHNSNGTLGPVQSPYTSGTMPNAPPEAICMADPGKVIVGIGGRIDSNHDLTTLTCSQRLYSPTQRKLVGDSEPIFAGTQPGFTLEMSAHLDNAAGDDADFAVLNGLGLRDRNNTVAQIELRWRTIL